MGGGSLSPLSSWIGEGNQGIVRLKSLPDGRLVAVKVCDGEGKKGGRGRDWKGETKWLIFSSLKKKKKK